VGYFQLFVSWSASSKIETQSWTHSLQMYEFDLTHILSGLDMSFFTLF